MWKSYTVISHNYNEIIEIGLRYFYRKGWSRRVYATYTDNVLFITIHSEQFSGENLELKIIQHVNFEIVNETIKFINKQYKINIPLITQEDLDSYVDCGTNDKLLNSL